MKFGLRIRDYGLGERGENKPTLSDNRGFTVTEILVVTVVIGILGALLMNFMVDKIVLNASLSAESNLQQQAKLTLDTVNNDIKHSTVTDDGNRWADDNAPDPADPYSWVGDGDTLILARPATDSDGNILYENAESYLTYKDNRIFFVGNGALYRRTLAADVTGNSATTTCPEGASSASCPADAMLAANISSFAVTYFDSNGNETTSPSNAGSVRITINIADTVFGKDITGSHSLTGVFRGVN